MKEVLSLLFCVVGGFAVGGVVKRLIRNETDNKQKLMKLTILLGAFVVLMLIAVVTSKWSVK